MTHFLTIDFETYYAKDYSLSKLTTQQYIDDPRFETIGVAVKKNDEPVQWFSGTKDQTKQWLKQFNWNEALVIAHNALFDLSILNWEFDTVPYGVIDTLSMARAVHGAEVGGSLAKLAEHYQLGQKGAEVVNALGKRRLDFTEEELSAYAGYCKNDVELTYKLFQELLPHFNKQELKLIDMTVRMHSEPQFMLDLPLLEQHLYEVQERKKALLEQSGIDKDVLMSNPKFAALLESMGVEPPKKISLTTGKETYAFAKTDEGFKALLEHPNEAVQAIAAARLGNKSTLEETRTQRFIGVAKSRGWLPAPLKYYGAMTGRWSASDYNLQNLPRGSKLKQAIIAPEGYEIVGADLSNIELRLGLWFAGQWDKLQLLADGKDLYKDFASGVFDVSYEDITKEQRFIGKEASLSLIYMVGHKKLRNAIKQRSGMDIGETEAQRIVKLYRTEYSKVKRSWHKAQDVLEAIRDNRYCTYGIGPLQLEVHGAKGIMLTSGMYLRYPQLENVQGENGEDWVYKWGRETKHIHSGKIFQHCIQALARCVMSEAMVRIQKKYPIALTIHDALYVLSEERWSELTLEYLISEMTTPPAWATGLPLAAEGGFGKSLAEC